MAFAQSDMLQREVFLFERIDSGRSNERMKYLKCIVFVRPTKQNIQLLAQELRSPKYGSYFLCKYIDILKHSNPKYMYLFLIFQISAILFLAPISNISPNVMKASQYVKSRSSMQTIWRLILIYFP